MLLDEYMKNTDHQKFWKLSTGEMENLIDEAVERIEKLEKLEKERAKSGQLDPIVRLPTFEECEKLAMETDYACFANEDTEKINTGDAAAFFLEGCQYMYKRFK